MYAFDQMMHRGRYRKVSNARVRDLEVVEDAK